MKRVLTLMLLTFVVITGCKYNSVNKEIEQAIELSTELSFSPVAAEKLAKGKPDHGWIKAQSLQYFSIEGQQEAELQLYVDPDQERPFDSGEVRAFLEANGTLYSIGIVSNYGLDDVEVKMVDRTSDEVKDLQIIGGLGAAYRELKVIQFDGEKQEWVLALTMGTPQIVDLDNDGHVELVAVSAGSLPAYVDIYRFNQGRFEKAEVAKAVQSEYAMLTNEWMDKAENWLIETGRGQTDKKRELYTYDNGRLVKVGYNKAE